MPINPADFHSMKLKVSFQNTSTRTKAISPDLCSLIEIGDKHLLLELPYASCNSNHNVFLEIFLEEAGSKPRSLLTVTGKVVYLEEVVSTIDEVITKTLRVNIHCVQFEEKSWQDLVQLYSRRQDAITNFLKAAKGF